MTDFIHPALIMVIGALLLPFIPGKTSRNPFLLVVPALVAMQQDVARQITAMRRGLRGRSIGLRAALTLGWVLCLGWLAATLGWAVTVGSLPGPVIAALPVLQSWSPELAGLVLFVAGAGIVAFGIYAVSAVAYLWARKRA